MRKVYSCILTSLAKYLYYSSYLLKKKKRLLNIILLKEKNNLLFFQKLFIKTQLQNLNMKFIF